MKRNPKIFQFVESGIRKKISSEIRNPRLWNPEYSFRKSWILLTTEIQCLEIRNPQRGIQNSRLSRFPLHEGGILLSASKIVFGRWNSKYTGRTSRTSPVADPGEGLVGPGTPLSPGSGCPPSPPPPPPFPLIWRSGSATVVVYITSLLTVQVSLLSEPTFVRENAIYDLIFLYLLLYFSLFGFIRYI